jgi:hypothetical protein
MRRPGRSQDRPDLQKVSATSPSGFGFGRPPGLGPATRCPEGPTEVACRLAGVVARDPPASHPACDCAAVEADSRRCRTARDFRQGRTEHGHDVAGLLLGAALSEGELACLTGHHELPPSSTVEADDEAAARHRLERRQTEPLPLAEREEDRRRSELSRDLLFRQARNRRELPPLKRAKQVRRPQEVHEVARPPAGHEGDPPGPRTCSGTGVEGVRVEAEPNAPDGNLREGELQVRSGVFRDGHDAECAAGGDRRPTRSIPP